MKNKILLISLAVVLAASLAVAAIGCGGGTTGPTPSDKIVIGSSRSLHGSLAIINSSAFGAIYPTYVSMVNGAGGIDVSGTKFQVDTKMLDDNSEDLKLVANMNTLVADVAAGTVHTIFGPDSTHFIDVAAPIANNGDCVMISVEGGATFLEQPGYLPDWPYVFITLSFSDWYQLPVFAQMLEDKSATKAYVFWQDDAHGQEYLATSAANFPSHGVSIVGNASVLATDPTFNPATLLSAANATSPDVVCCFCYPDEIIGLTLTAIGGGYNFDGWIVGPGGCFGWFGTGPPIGANAEGIMTFAVANNATSPAMENLFNNVLAGGVVAGQDFWGHPLYWAAMEMWQNAVEQVGEVTTEGKFLIDQGNLKAELASYNSAGSAVTTVLGDTWYTMFGTGGGILAYECHTGEIGQWQSGYMEIVGYSGITTDLPKYKVTASLIYPKPNWS